MFFFFSPLNSNIQLSTSFKKNLLRSLLPRAVVHESMLPASSSSFPLWIDDLVRIQLIQLDFSLKCWTRRSPEVPFYPYNSITNNSVFTTNNVKMLNLLDLNLQGRKKRVPKNGTVNRVSKEPYRAINYFSHQPLITILKP